MRIIDGDDHAFPSQSNAFSLTKREYFAAMAMMGLCANPYPMKEAIRQLREKDEDGHVFGDLVESAVLCADELIKELNKRT